MQTTLAPCPYRQVDVEGRILCNQIKSGEREVTASICRICPIAQIDCTHLRATLNRQSSSPLTVRWGNGKTEVWHDPAPPLALERAACSAKTILILSPHDCTGCALRQALVPLDAIPAVPKRMPANIPFVAANGKQAKVEVEHRTNVVRQKILQIHKWLQQKNANKTEEEEMGAFPIPLGRKSIRSVAEERRVGWTD